MGRLIVLAGSGMMLCTSHSMRAGGHAASVEAALGDRLCLMFERVQPHVQDSQVDEALALALELHVDAIVGLGGGSPIGLAKAVAWKIEENQAGHPILFTFPTDQPLIPVVAIPTTYAGSEMTPLFGVTHNEPADLSGSTFGCGNTDCRRIWGAPST
jgi:alcohol dehydrogenase class IV